MKKFITQAFVLLALTVFAAATDSVETSQAVRSDAKIEMPSSDDVKEAMPVVAVDATAFSMQEKPSIVNSMAAVDPMPGSSNSKAPSKPKQASNAKSASSDRKNNAPKNVKAPPAAKQSKTSGNKKAMKSSKDSQQSNVDSVNGTNAKVVPAQGKKAQAAKSSNNMPPQKKTKQSKKVAVEPSIALQLNTTETEPMSNSSVADSKIAPEKQNEKVRPSKSAAKSKNANKNAADKKST